jgi:DNA-binding response OmpR family regulator
MNTLQRTSISHVSEKSSLSVNDIQWDCQQRVISIGRRMIKLTPAEYRLLAPLREGHPVTYSHLAMSAYGYALDSKVREMMDKHIDRIRGKIEGSGVYVYCILGYGYMLLPATSREQSDRVAS